MLARVVLQVAKRAEQDLAGGRESGSLFPHSGERPTSVTLRASGPLTMESMHTRLWFNQPHLDQGSVRKSLAKEFNSSITDNSVNL